MSLGGRFEAVSIIPETHRQAFSILLSGSKRVGFSFGTILESCHFSGFDCRLKCLECVTHFLDLFSDHLVLFGRYIGRCEQHAGGSPGAIHAWYEIGLQRACGLMMLERSSFYYRSHPRDHRGLSMRIKELAMTRIRFGYLRLTVLLKREGWPVGKKLVYRLYRELKLQVRSKRRKKLASQQRGPLEIAQQANQRWSMDFVTDRLEDGRRFRVLTIIDQYHRYSPALVPALSFSGARVVEELDRIARASGYPRSITCDNGPEFCSRAFDQWAHLHRVRIDYIRPGKPVENGFIESFNARLRDECLNLGSCSGRSKMLK